jgi:MFS family permease
MATPATRSRVSSKAPVLAVAGALFVLLMDGNLPTPLYAVYRDRFGFSGTELTLIFAIYAVALIPSLLVFGQLSDRVGRRPVIVGGLGVAAVGLLALAMAQSTAWLFVARAIQGVALCTTVGMLPPQWSRSSPKATMAARRSRRCSRRAVGRPPGRCSRARSRNGRRHRASSATSSALR